MLIESYYLSSVGVFVSMFGIVLVFVLFLESLVFGVVCSFFLVLFFGEISFCVVCGISFWSLVFVLFSESLDVLVVVGVLVLVLFMEEYLLDS